MEVFPGLNVGLPCPFPWNTKAGKIAGTRVLIQNHVKIPWKELVNFFCEKLMEVSWGNPKFVMKPPQPLDQGNENSRGFKWVIFLVFGFKKRTQPVFF